MRSIVFNRMVKIVKPALGAGFTEDAMGTALGVAAPSNLLILSAKQEDTSVAQSGI